MVFGSESMLLLFLLCLFIFLLFLYYFFIALVFLCYSCFSTECPSLAIAYFEPSSLFSFLFFFLLMILYFFPHSPWLLKVMGFYPKLRISTQLNNINLTLNRVRKYFRPRVTFMWLEKTKGTGSNGVNKG